MASRRPTGTSEGGQFASVHRGRPSVALEAPAVPTPGGEGWREGTYESGVHYHERRFTLGDGAVASQTFCAAAMGDTLGEAEVLAHGGLTIAQGDKLPGELHYRLLLAPRADTGEKVEAVMINWVEVQGNRGKGWASAMYAAVREAHPDAVISAADVLEAPGKRLVRHYRGKYPQTHTGRFDTDKRIHPTTGPDDPIYRRSVLGELK